MTIDDATAPSGGMSLSVRAWSAATIPVRLIEIAFAGSLAGVLMILLWQGSRPDLAYAPSQPFFWLKALYTGSLAAVALGATAALARPNMSLRPALAAAAALISAMLIAAAFQAPRLDPVFLAKLLRPEGVWTCIFNIASLAAPMLVFATLGLRQADLERPALTGLASGLFCGGVAASVYGLHCTHSTFVFVGLWYTSAIAICGMIGAVALKLVWLGSGRLIPE